MRYLFWSFVLLSLAVCGEAQPIPRKLKPYANQHILKRMREKDNSNATPVRWVDLSCEDFNPGVWLVYELWPNGKAALIGWKPESQAHADWRSRESTPVRAVVVSPEPDDFAQIK